MTKRIEIDHLTTREAFNALGPDSVGLGYNAGGVSYAWEARKTRSGSLRVVVEGTLVLVADLALVARLGAAPVTALVADLVAARTGNDAEALIALCPALGR